MTRRKLAIAYSLAALPSLSWALWTHSDIERERTDIVIGRDLVKDAEAYCAAHPENQ